MSKEVKVQLCHVCEGFGRTVRYGRKELGEPHIVEATCSRCEGAGRFRVTTIVEPFKPTEDIPQHVKGGDTDE